MNVVLIDCYIFLANSRQRIGVRRRAIILRKTTGFTNLQCIQCGQCATMLLCITNKTHIF